MTQIVKTTKKWSLSPVAIKDILFHTFFFWTRILGIVAADLVSFKIPFQLIRVAARVDDFLDIITFNTFLFFLVIGAVIDGNIYKYYMSIIFMFHNAILTIFISSSPGNKLKNRYWIIDGIITFLFFLEGVLSLISTYLRRNETNISLFKKVGLNSRINNAFATRKFVEACGSVNTFLALTVTLKLTTPISVQFSVLASLSIFYTFLTFVQQLFISVEFNEEKIE